MTKAEREKRDKNEFINKLVLSLAKDYHYWYIPGNVPSSKNGKRSLPIHKTSQKGYKYITRCILAPSPATEKYRKEKATLFYDDGLKFRALTEKMSKPLQVGFFFINSTKHEFDLINKTQTIQDLMVVHGWIDDDNADNLIPYYPKIMGKYFLTDTYWQGVIIMLRK